VIKLDVRWIAEGTSRRMGYMVSSASWERKGMVNKLTLLSQATHWECVQVSGSSDQKSISMSPTTTEVS
jgi:hypothetical protein